VIRRAALFASLVLLSACSKLPDGVDKNALVDNVGAAIGDPATCVVLAQVNTGEVIWRSSHNTVCTVERQACTRPGVTTVLARVKEAAAGQTIVTGCESVSWAAGPTARPGVVYAAVMYGERALPGMEMERRLKDAFADAGL